MTDEGSSAVTVIFGYVRSSPKLMILTVAVLVVATAGSVIYAIPSSNDVGKLSVRVDSDNTVSEKSVKYGISQ